MTVKAISATSAELAVGDVWLIDVCVTDVDGYAADDAPVVTVTLPAGSTSTPSVTALAGGRYRAAYVVGSTGRYIARAVTTANGVAEFAAYVTGVTDGTAMPDVEDVKNYLDGGTGNSWTDAEIEDALSAEATAQRRVCRVPAAYPDDLRQALMRRVARNLSLRKLPLMMTRGDAEGGDQAVIPGRDPEVRRFEAPFRKLVVG